MQEREYMARTHLPQDEQDLRLALQECGDEDEALNIRLEAYRKVKSTRADYVSLLRRLSTIFSSSNLTSRQHVVDALCSFCDNIYHRVEKDRNGNS